MKALVRNINLPPAPEPTHSVLTESAAVRMDDRYVAKHTAGVHGHHWTQAEIDEITQMRERGMTWKEISAEFGLGKEAARVAWTKNHW